MASLILSREPSSAFVREWHRLRKYRKPRRSAYGKVRVSGSESFWTLSNMVIIMLLSPIIFYDFAYSCFAKKNISKYILFVSGKNLGKC